MTARTLAPALADAVAIAQAANQPQLAVSLERQLAQVRQGWPLPPAGIDGLATAGAR